MWLLFSFGCSTEFGNLWRKPDAETNFDTASNFFDDFGDNPDGNSPPTSALDELWSQLDPSYCEGLVTGSGATGYFIGYYELSEDELWYGIEQHVLFSVGGQEIIGNDSCQTTWAVTATPGEVGSCSACLFSLAVDALQDNGQSNCPESIQETSAEWSASYDILIENGVSEFYFYESGTFIASGKGDSSFISFTSEPVCYTF